MYANFFLGPIGMLTRDGFDVAKNSLRMTFFLSVVLIKEKII